jgi:tetratricopeptide (TPR) repeat protein
MPLPPKHRLPAAVVLIVCGLAARIAPAQSQETSLTSEERAKLDTFEGVLIDKADAVFAGRDWPRALAEYDAFVVQFPDSKVTPYAILRKGRSLQEVQKRFEAIAVYQEVLDFFPDDVKFAAAALYRIGECHMQNGDVSKAMKAWFELSEDPEYVKEPLGAPALNGLAENLIKQGKVEEGIKRYDQVAIEFRTKNPDSANGAAGRVVNHYVRTKPDADKLRDFHVRFHHPQGQPPELAADEPYWRGVRETIRHNSQFTDVQKGEKNDFFRYWAGRMQPMLPANDDHQLDVARYLRIVDGDEAAWVARLDKQFADHQKEGDAGRIIRWIGLFAANRPKAEEYYRKLDFAKLSNDAIVATCGAIIDNGGDPALAANAFDKLRFAEMKDEQKQSLVNWLQQRSQFPGSRDLAIRTCRSFSDATQGTMALLRYLHWRAQYARVPADIPEGLAVAAEMQKTPATAKEAYGIAANLLQWSGKYEEAIAAYRQADAPPGTLYSIADCLVALGRLDPAVSQLREIENFFQDQAPVAALKIAYLYRDAGIKEKFVRTLRGVLKKYPKSGQSSEAHQRLEEMGLPIGGGVDAEE